jgi:hypothetical protein
MTFARGARVTRRPAAVGHADLRGSELAAILLPSLHADCELFGPMRVRGIGYRVKAWRRTSATGAEWIELKLEPDTSRDTAP